ncbi:hypothetical protein M3Y97_00059000 [Aphelenchoides bicaudatus]|nr:hypothetical protein M3Y97_00059000 [Aphelenchoides bicaudatus]
MTSKSRTFVFVFFACVIVALLTSGIWLAAYFIKVKPSSECKTTKDEKSQQVDPGPECTKTCTYELVESMPEGLYQDQNVLRF